MGMTPKDESKSFRIVSQNDDGVSVFSASATYNRRNINMNFEMLDMDYCTENHEEVESAITAFIARLNTALTEDNFPIIHG